MSSQNKTQTEIPSNLKGIYQSLKEIDKILSSPRQSLDMLVNGDTPVNALATGEEMSSDTVLSLEHFVSVIESIYRSSNQISRYTNKLIGN